MSTRFPLEKDLPDKPTFSNEIWDKCRKDKDFIPILFEWYKYIGVTCNILASISRDSPAIRKISTLNYAVLIGLLNRCSRLMTSNIRLSATGIYGETISILDRSIYESAIIVQWLCQKDNEECFQRFLAEGIKKDLILKDHIQKSIAERKGEALVIENRMLSSIQECIDSTGLSEEQIRQMKPLLDYWSMCRDIGLSERFYIGAQRMGSHEVHGSWTSLKSNYLRQDAYGEYYPRDLDVRPHEDHFMTISIVIIDTLEIFIEYIIPNKRDREPIESVIKESATEFGELTREIVSSDFELDID